MNKTGTKKTAARLLVLSFLILSGAVGGCASNTTTSQLDSSPTNPPTAQAPATTEQTATTPANSTDPVAETTVVPGERVGPVTRDTTRQELAELFGEANLQDEQVDVGEGFTKPGTTVNLSDNRSFSIVWSDETQTQPAEVRDLGSAWRTPEGIGVGTSLAELQDEMGAFELYGFGWDYGGTVILRGSELAKYDNLLVLRLHPAPEAIEESPEALQTVSSDRAYAASNPQIQELNPEVGEMIVYLSPR